jgi:membrane protease YdiL (CAAX protease family)
MQEEFDPKWSEEFPQDEAWAAELAEKERVAKAKTNLRFAASRIGLATAVLVAVWMLAVTVVSIVCGVLGVAGAAFYNKYLMVINEVTLAVGIAAALPTLLSVPRVNLHKNKISFGAFMKILAIGFGASYIGNLIGSFLLSIWNTSTGNSVGDELTTLLYGMDPLLMFFAVGILGPLLEELFFRKLLIDRLRVFGEATAILLSAFLFALFHMSASQMLYALAGGVMMGYFYCRTGNYWLTSLIHMIFNTVSGVIPMLFLPKINAFEAAMQNLEASLPTDAGADVLAEMMMPVIEEYGPVLGLYGLYSLIVLALNITGIVLLCKSFAKFKERKGEFSLPFKTSAKTVFKTPGIIVYTVFLGIMTVISLFG